MLAVVASIAAGRAASPGKVAKVRLGLSESIFSDLNDNDARAAVKAWSILVATAAQLEIEGNPELMRPEGIIHAIAYHLIDGFSITVPEYARVARFVDPIIFLNESAAKTQLEYLILVRQDSGLHDLPGLHGKSLLAFQHADMCVSQAWLETLLASSNLEASERFFSSISKSTKVSQTVLPVFFGRVDACLITRPAFDTMCELNPQLRQKLRIIAVSPKVVPFFLGLHKDSSDELRRRVRDALIAMTDGVGGRQILTLFQVQRLVPMDTSILKSSLDILSAYDRLKAQHPDRITNHSASPIR